MIKGKEIVQRKEIIEKEESLKVKEVEVSDFTKMPCKHSIGKCKFDYECKEDCEGYEPVGF